ncbi:nuclear transport factor 2 family protein [Peristeroidobacter soli]|uniref:nuclear transport factor 2 family protein n=1 Tax=Peristeroidobacter soli TaxID=2497877 RepID=UPI0013007E6E|nr:nuclear transport factor 2 family protein [Peristeroidobacter soli]
MRMMSLLAVLTIATQGMFAPARAGTQAAPTEASLRAADQEQRRQVFEGKTDELARMLHPNLLVNGPSRRVLTRDLLLESVRTGAIAKEKFERVAEAVHITGNVGVLVGHEMVVAAPGSSDFKMFGDTPFRRRYTDIFLFQDGKWWLLARQAGIVAGSDQPSGDAKH